MVQIGQDKKITQDIIHLIMFIAKFTFVHLSAKNSKSDGLTWSSFKNPFSSNPDLKGILTSFSLFIYSY